MYRRNILLSLSALSLAGCANFTPPATQRPLATNGVHWITYDSSRRGTLLASDGSKIVRSCAEPAPDTAYSFTNSLKGKAKKPEGPEAEVDLAFNATAVALAGRDNLVLLAREAMFRLCEARANKDITEDQYNTQFGAVLQQITQISSGNQTQDAALVALVTGDSQSFNALMTRQSTSTQKTVTTDEDDKKK